MRLSSRLNFSLIAGVTIVSLALAFYQTQTERRGMRRELESHAAALASSMEKSAAPLVARHSYSRLQKLVDGFQMHEHLLGVSIYDMEGRPVAMTSNLALLPSVIPNPVWRAVREFKSTGEFFSHQDRPLHVFAVPLRAEEPVIGALAVFYDAQYIEMEYGAMWRQALTGILVQTVLIVCVTLLILRFSVRRPLARLADWLREVRSGEATESPDLPEEEDFQPLKREVSRLATSLTAARAAAEEEARLRNSLESLWTPERLRVFVQNKLGNSRIFAISNREPYEHTRRNGKLEWSVPASGLVTALEPILRACEGTWIAQGTGDADRESVDENDRLAVPPDHPQYTLRRVWVTPEEHQGFYLGVANEGLWPLCHIAHTRPIFRAEDWEQYEKVNRRFADIALEEIEGEKDPVVLVQDYHFALAPRMIKDQRPDARVGMFWHIPWPNPEAFGICPWRREVLHGLLGADLIGFHIQAHCNNFLETVDAVLESRINWERFAVDRRGHMTLVRPFPISVNFTEETAPVESSYAERAELLRRHGVKASMLGVGVDRIDYTKGIPERFRGLEVFFERCPRYKEQFTFVQIGAPSRGTIRSYQELQDEVQREADRINARFQTNDWKPIIFLPWHHSHEQILQYYRTADLCMVTSLHDGMNLVAKEYVAARADDQGVLILSHFAGASQELVDALVVNPYDTEDLAQAIHRALEMTPDEKKARMARMRAYVREHNIYRWAGTLIAELTSLRTREVPPRSKIAPIGEFKAGGRKLA